MKRLFAVLPLAGLAFAAACAETPTTALTPDGEAVLSSGVSTAGVRPTSHPGNFVAEDDDQICYNMLPALTGELKGFKIDPPVNGSTAGIAYTLSSNLRYLDWSSDGRAEVLGVVVKGGPNYHLYNYLDSGWSADQRLHSPMHGRNLPQISHFNFCYRETTGGGAGCTPGYWRNHADRWEGVTSGQSLDAVFDVTSGLGASYTLGQAIWAQGGGINALARHATAGLLNAHGGVPNSDGTTVDYAYTVAEVLAMVKAAIDSGNADEIEATKNLLAAANEAGCPLSGTRAVKVQ